MQPDASLSRRERQIMDVLFARGEATVNDIQAALPDPPTHTAVRTLLKILNAKGRVKRRKLGREYLYAPRTDRTKAGRSALRSVIQTFFDGSLERALVAHLADRDTKLSEDELQRAAELIESARRRESGAVEGARAGAKDAKKS